MRVGDYFFVFSVEVVNSEGTLLKRLEFCDSIEQAGETAQKYEKKLKKNEEIWFVPYGVGQCKADPPTLDATYVDYFTTPDNNRYTKAYYSDIKYRLRSAAPSSKYSTEFTKRRRVCTPYGKMNRNLSAYVFVVGGDSYTIVRKTKKAVTDTDTIVSYKRAMCQRCWNNVKHCCCEDLPVGFYNIDENIQPAIIWLNRKGYYTNSCCEGHSWMSSDACVSFLHHYKFPIDLPEHWYEEGNAIHLSYKDAVEGNESFEEVKKRKMDELTEWAKNLPEFEKSFITKD